MGGQRQGACREGEQPRHWSAWPVVGLERQNGAATPGRGGSVPPVNAAAASNQHASARTVWEDWRFFRPSVYGLVVHGRGRATLLRLRRRAPWNALTRPALPAGIRVLFRRGGGEGEVDEPRSAGRPMGHVPRIAGESRRPRRMHAPFSLEGLQRDSHQPWRVTGRRARADWRQLLAVRVSGRGKEGRKEAQLASRNEGAEVPRISVGRNNPPPRNRSWAAAARPGRQHAMVAEARHATPSDGP